MTWYSEKKVVNEGTVYLTSVSVCLSLSLSTTPYISQWTFYFLCTTFQWRTLNKLNFNNVTILNLAHSLTHEHITQTHTHIHTYIHTYTHTYIHTYTHTHSLYIHSFSFCFFLFFLLSVSAISFTLTQYVTKHWNLSNSKY